MVIRIFLVCFLIVFYSSETVAQQWNGRVEGIRNSHGVMVDSFKVFDWPATTPSYLHNSLDFVLFNKTRLHNNRIDLKYMSADKHHSTLTALERYYWKGNFAIYKSATGDLDNAKLYKYGVSLGQVKFPVYEDGHYLLLVVWGGDKEIADKKGDGRMIYCKVKDGIVHMHDAKKCY